MKSNLLMLTALALLCSFTPIKKMPDVVKIQSEEVKLYNLIMEYRKANNLPEIPLSKSLTFVAGETCGYSADQDCASCMWSKPSALTSYEGYGYQMSYSSCAAPKSTCSALRPSCSVMSAERIFNRWMGSAASREMFLGQGIWKNDSWKAIGIAIKDNNATAWFGRAVDKEGSPVFE